jgi:hypothetical protein
MCLIESIPVIDTPGPRKISRIRTTADLNASTDAIMLLFDFGSVKKLASIFEAKGGIFDILCIYFIISLTHFKKIGLDFEI